MARKKQRKGRASEHSIDRSGRQIHEKVGQIKALTDRRRDVESQSRDGVSYRVPFGCGKPACVTRDRKGVRVQTHGCGRAHAAQRDRVIPRGEVDHRWDWSVPNAARKSMC